MDITASYSLINGFVSPAGGAPPSRASTIKSRPAESRDLIVTAVSRSNASVPQTRLVKDITEDTETGYRRTRTFEQADGRTFTRIEEVTATGRGAERNVIQQNASGSITRLQQLLERQDDGSFRRTSRFTDATGQSETKIETGLTGADPFLLAGLPAGPAPGFYATQQNATRGHQLDIRA